MAKLEPPLEGALAAWRADLDHARTNAVGEGVLAALESQRVSVIVTFSGDVSALEQAGLATGYPAGGIVSGTIAFADLPRLGIVPGVISVAKEPTFNPLLDGTVAEMRVPWKVPPTTPWPGRGAGVIVAVIDTGIDVFHDSFRKADGTTRILELWDQTAGITGGNAPPAGFSPQGRIYSFADINASLTGGPVFPSTDTSGHGTHVAGIAAGNGRQDDRCSLPGRYVGVAPDADLVIVKAIGVTGASVGDALLWCAQVRTRHAGNKPVVINCSFGSDTGPHDGTSASDARLRPILRPATGPPQGIAIVVAAGNAGGAEIHESGTILPSQPSTISFYIPDQKSWQDPDTGDTLDIWYNGAATLTVEIIAPPNASVSGSNTTGPVAPGPAVTRPIGGMTVTVTSSASAFSNGRKQIHVRIATPTGAQPQLAVRPGVWQVTLTETAGAAASWDAWFETKHKQPYPTFRLPTESGPPVARRREHTINEPGTSPDAITVASYNNSNGELAASSSRGAPAQAGIAVGTFKPTVAAPGVGVAAPRSRNEPTSNSSCCDQKVIDKDGTSMAAPHVAGVVALMFEKNRTLTFEQVRTHLQHSARIDAIPAPEVPPIFDAALGIRAGHLWGSGKVDAAVALTETPAAPGSGGGGGGGGGPIPFSSVELGYNPHTLVSRLGDWQNRFGPRAGLMLFASLVSEHVDEVLRLVNHNRRVGAVWRRYGGPALVGRLLHGPAPVDSLLPRAIDGCDVPELLARFLPMLARFGGPRLKSDVAHFGDFVNLVPQVDFAGLDAAALERTRSV